MAPAEGNELLLLGTQAATLGASEYLAVRHGLIAGHPPALDLAVEHNVQSLVRTLVSDGLVAAAHDTSEGGLLIALAEMLIASGGGASVSLQPLMGVNDGRFDRTCFGEAASRVIVAVPSGSVDAVRSRAEASGVEVLRLGVVGGASLSTDIAGDIDVEQLRGAWESGLTVGR
jgi:phosphoribosylformylglycinamidine synthase